MDTMPEQHDFIGLIPAAGVARRLGPLKQSKEILSVHFAAEASGDADKGKPACHNLLEGLKSAGVAKAIMVLRVGKSDISETLAKNPVPGIEIAFLLMNESAGVPWTLDRAYDLVRGSNVLMGFPDILIRPSSFYRKIVDAFQARRSDVVLGIMHAADPRKVDIVELSDDERVTRIIPKPRKPETATAWIAAAWRPTFTEYLHRTLVEYPTSGISERELYLGNIFASAIGDLEISAVVCSEGNFIDIGTPEDLARVVAKT